MPTTKTASRKSVSHRIFWRRNVFPFVVLGPTSSVLHMFSTPLVPLKRVFGFLPIRLVKSKSASSAWKALARIPFGMFRRWPKFPSHNNVVSSFATILAIEQCGSFDTGPLNDGKSVVRKLARPPTFTFRSAKERCKHAFPEPRVTLSHFKDYHQSLPNLSSICLLYTSPSPRDKRQSRMPSSA